MEWVNTIESRYFPIINEFKTWGCFVTDCCLKQLEVCPQCKKNDAGNLNKKKKGRGSFDLYLLNSNCQSINVLTSVWTLVHKNCQKLRLQSMYVFMTNHPKSQSALHRKFLSTRLKQIPLSRKIKHNLVSFSSPQNLSKALWQNSKDIKEVTKFSWNKKKILITWVLSKLIK